MAVAYDERRISFIANEVSEAIEQASFGRIPWAAAADIFSSAFPCGFVALINQDFIHDSINFIEWVNLDDHAIETYVELGLTYETVRQRTKVVFQKTGVRSQSALCALLARYAGEGDVRDKLLSAWSGEKASWIRITSNARWTLATRL
jgi:hypothetical protein